MYFEESTIQIFLSLVREIGAEILANVVDTDLGPSF